MYKKEENGCFVFYPKDTLLCAPQVEIKKSSLPAENDIRIFYYKQKEFARYRLIEIKRPTPDVVKARREEFNTKKRALAQKVVKELALLGLMRGKVRQSDIDNAKQGICPRGYVLHHIIPLSLGGTNDLNNLMLIKKEVHEKLHTRVWNPVRDSVPYLPKGHRNSISAFVWLIDLPVIMTPKDAYLLDTLCELEVRAQEPSQSKKTKVDFRKAGSINCKEGWVQKPHNCGRWGNGTNPSRGITFSR